MMPIDIGWAVKFFHDPNIYEITVLYMDTQDLYYYDPITETEYLKNFDDIENVWSVSLPTHKIDGCYFPQKNEIEASWECLATGKKVSVIFTITEGNGEYFAEVISPGVYQLGQINKKKQDARICSRCGITNADYIEGLKKGDN